MATYFRASATKFLRDLKRHNEREWFDARKGTYEAELKAPMLALIAEVNAAFESFAPEHVRPPQKCFMRIYRDIRFSKDKRPYKTNVAAWWARQGLEKTSGGGFYFHLSDKEVVIAAGVYMPEREQLQLIRRFLLEHHEELRRITRSKKVLARMQPLDGLTMTRGPKGFPPNHPAMDLLMQRQWGLSATLPVDVATRPGLLKEIVERFRLAAPLVALLNEPLTGKPKKPLF